jgi:hypothetical protein
MKEFTRLATRYGEVMEMDEWEAYKNKIEKFLLTIK